MLRSTGGRGGRPGGCSFPRPRAVGRGRRFPRGAGPLAARAGKSRGAPLSPAQPSRYHDACPSRATLANISNRCTRADRALGENSELGAANLTPVRVGDPQCSKARCCPRCWCWRSRRWRPPRRAGTRQICARTSPRAVPPGPPVSAHAAADQMHINLARRIRIYILGCRSDLDRLRTCVRRIARRAGGERVNTCVYVNNCIPSLLV